MSMSSGSVIHSLAHRARQTQDNCGTTANATTIFIQIRTLDLEIISLPVTHKVQRHAEAEPEFFNVDKLRHYQADFKERIT